MNSKATTAARVLLGLVFFGFGLNGLLRILQLPPGEGAAAVFINGLIATRYFFPLLFLTYLLTGSALLIGRFVPLALAVLAPVIVNIAVVLQVSNADKFVAERLSCVLRLPNRRDCR